MNQEFVEIVQDKVRCDNHDKKVKYFNQQQTIGYCYLCIIRQDLKEEDLIEFDQSDIHKKDSQEVKQKTDSQEVKQKTDSQDKSQGIFKKFVKNNKNKLIIGIILLIFLLGTIMISQQDSDSYDQQILQAKRNIQFEYEKSQQQFELLEFEYQRLLEHFPEYEQTIMSQKESQYLFSLFNNTLNMKQIFKASIDGFGGESFHNKTKNYKNLIVVVLSDTKQVFGGFTNLGFQKEGENGFIQGQGKSFIFQLTQKVKYPCINKKKEIYYSSLQGPIFGQYELFISDNSNQNHHSSNELGRSYESKMKEQNIFNPFLAGSLSFQVIDYEVYHVQV